MAEQTPVVPAPVKPSAINVSPASLKGPPAVEPVVPVVEKVETKTPEIDFEARKAEFDRAHAKIAKERREVAAARQASKAEAEELAKYRAEKAEAKRNPDKFLKSLYGEGYYDTLTRLKVDGVAPADLVASEMDERFKSVEQKLAEKQAELDKKLSDYQAREEQAAKNAYLNSAVEHAKANPEKYKLIAAFEKKGSHGSIAQKIESHFRTTAKQDAEGNWLPGETLTAEQAAEAVEKDILEVGEVFRTYFAAETKTKAPTETQRQTSSPRRAEANPQENDGWTPPTSERERLKRAFAVGDAHLASRQQH